MPIQAVCGTCSKEYSLKEEYAGKKVKCKACGGVFRVPAVAPVVEEAEEIEEFLEEPPPRPPVRTGKGSATKSRGAKHSKPKGLSGWKAVALVGGGIVGLFGLLFVGGVALYFFGKIGSPAPQPVGFQPNGTMPPGLQGMPTGMPPGMPGGVTGGFPGAMPPFGAPPGFPGQVRGTPVGDPSALFPIGSVPVPNFPDLGVPRQAPNSPIRIHDLSLATANPTAFGPGTRMNLRVYLPASDARPASQGCVLVAPAGTNLVVGNDLDDANYHAETLPYAEAGFVTIMFSLDGGVRDLGQMNNAELSSAYRAFSAAQAGLVNARNALEFALARVPQVDPRRIYIAGHSSAAVLALLYGEHEPRLKGCIAYAAASDVEQRLADLKRDRSAELLLPGIGNFIRQSSPRTHMANMQCPVFLFHAADDSNEPVGTSIRFAADLQRLGKTVTFEQVPRGDHYDSMIREGIPRAIRWMGGRGG